jgi:hypothetical protein
MLKLQKLMLDLMIAIRENDFRKAIEINNEITKVLKTYEKSC